MKYNLILIMLIILGCGCSEISKGDYWLKKEISEEGKVIWVIKRYNGAYYEPRVAFESKEDALRVWRKFNQE